MHPSHILIISGILMTITGFGISTTEVNQSPKISTWTVKDDNNQTCMLMSMSATYTTIYGAEIPVPQKALASRVNGSCNENTANFKLSWQTSDGYPIYTINILFQEHGGSYQMTSVAGTERTSPSVVSDWTEERNSFFPSATVGHSMTCNDSIVGSLELHYFDFQPFAVSSDGKFGEAEACSSTDGIIHSGNQFFIFAAFTSTFTLILGSNCFM